MFIHCYEHVCFKVTKMTFVFAVLYVFPFLMILHLHIQCTGLFTFITGQNLDVWRRNLMDVDTHGYVGTSNVCHKFFILLCGEVAVIAFYVMMDTFKMGFQFIC